MPRAKKPATKTAPSVTPAQPWACSGKAEWGGFINVRLSEEHRAQFDAWLPQNKANVMPALEELAAAGMKTAFSYDHENECTVVTFTGRLITGPDERWCMTTRAGSLAEALALACWKHFVLLDQKYDDYLPKSDTMRRWG